MSKTSEQVVCTIVPEQFRKCEDNAINVLLEPVGICRSDEASIFLVVDRTGKLVSVRLHYPAEIKILQEKLSFPVAVLEVFGVALIAEQGKKMLCLDWKSNLKIDINKTDKRMLQIIASKLQIPGSQQMKVMELRRKIKERKNVIEGQRPKQTVVKLFECNIDIDQPAALEKTVDDHLFVSNLSITKRFWKLELRRKLLKI